MCPVIHLGCEAWQGTYQGENLVNGARTMMKTEKVTEKMNEQENADNVIKFTGMDRHYNI